METHFYPIDFFFFFHQFFPMNTQKDSLLFYFMPCQYFQINECKKNLEIREGSQEQWKHTSTHWIFFFLSLVFLMSIWKDSLFLFGMPHSYLQTNECKKNSRARNAQEVPNVRSYVSADVPALAMMRTSDGEKHKIKEMQQMGESLACVKVQRF